MNLNEAVRETIKVAREMPGNDKWLVHQNFVEMIEEVGELANAIQTEEGYKSKKRQKSKINDSICDILYELFRIADHYQIDLDKEYPEVLKEINERRKKGEFDHI